MKKLNLIFALLLASFVTLQAQSNWNVDAAHSSIEFTVTHMVISEVTGKFGGFEAMASSSNDDFNNASIEFSADVSTINTGIEKRDAHLRSADFFDAEKFPKLTFKSSSFKKSKGNKYTLKGDLTMHGVTKQVELDVVYNGTIKDPYGQTKAGFKVSGELNRADFGLTWNSTLETGGVVVSEEVGITANIQLVKEVAAGK